MASINMMRKRAALPLTSLVALADDAVIVAARERKKLFTNDNKDETTATRAFQRYKTKGEMPNGNSITKKSAP